ncbi:MAG: FHA domain-containing protein [Myxococcales bacterium]|nr:FHA domain-containing protein [Myxococcales bacterium]MCB9749622.1 FHA domain-containing protein [Myxococcales bacterium]
MGVLLHVKTGTEHTLSARVVVGRSGSCQLRLGSRAVSGEHATLHWTGGGWELRDLGSSNGTWLGERRLAVGERAALREGDSLGFGSRSDRWSLTDAGPPTAVARPVTGGAPTRAEGGVLPLPSPERPEVVLLEVSEGHWVLETDSAQTPVHDQEVVEAGGIPWRLYLPIVLARTSQAEAEPASSPGLALRFAVSRDEEFVELTVARGDESARLEPRTFHYMLLTLARLRRDDQETSARERGWIYVDDLAKQIGIDARTVNVYLMRARRQLGEVGVPPAALIERRPGARLRMGSLPVSIETL